MEGGAWSGCGCGFDISISAGVIFIAWVFFIKSVMFVVLTELRSIIVVIDPFYIVKIGT